jgi:hypothetical protein
MNNDKAKRKLETFDFVKVVAEKHDQEECLSLAASLLVTTIATLVGNDAAYDFSRCLNDLIMETLGGNMTVEVLHKEVKK